MRRPIIGDLASYVHGQSPALKQLNASAIRLPEHVHYAEIAYSGTQLGFLARNVKVILLEHNTHIKVDYYIFDESGNQPGDQVSSAAAENILEVGRKSIDYPGDGLIPVNNQQFKELAANPKLKFDTLICKDQVLHTEEPNRVNDLKKQLHSIAKTWFP